MKTWHVAAVLLMLCALQVFFVYSNAECVPACTSSAECDDASPLTTDACIGAGDCGAYCSHSECSVACRGDADCDDGIAATTDVCAGKGGCSAECRSLEGCGDAECRASVGETPCTCPQDCGSCSGALPGECKERACIGAECAAVSASACCGNARCEKGEDYGSCGADCGAKAIRAEILGDENTDLWHGGKIIISAAVYAGEFGVSGADVNANGFFGELKLYNDGAHNDGAENDNVYGNSGIVPEDAEYGAHIVGIDAEFAGARAHAERVYEIRPDFYITVSADRKNYTKGDTVKISGTVVKGGKGIAAELELEINNGAFAVWRARTESGVDGGFAAEYRGTDASPEGMLRIIASGMGEEGGEYPESAVEGIFMFPAEVKSFLNLDIGGLKNGSYAEGEKIEFTVDVTDENFGAVDGAKVLLVYPDGSTAELREVAWGRYLFSGAADFEGGKFGDCRVIAVKNVEGARQEGRAAVEIEFASLCTEFGCEGARDNVEVAGNAGPEPGLQPVVVFAGVSALCIAAYAALRTFIRGKRTAELNARNRRTMELEEKIKGVQARYFKGAMNAEEYYGLEGKYKAEIEKERGR
ncbi:MAG: hypothetical protein V1676_05110 [Candidatus Diapherotrites archaeon]